MNLVSYEPWGLLQRFHNEISRLYDGAVAESAADRDGSHVVTSHWSPAVDVREEADRFVISADVPGVASEDIEITMEQGRLVIKGHRGHESSESKDGFKRVERVRGTFYRRFSLPDSADAEHIEAKTENGVLKVTIPKQEKAQPRRIPVA